MGRRKKEPGEVHRERIGTAAERLFLRRGIRAATMDEIAKEAGYSKATLYVYFGDKEELIGFLVRKSMEMLSDLVREAVTGEGTVKEKYFGICEALARYQEQYPLYFHLALGRIHVDLEEGNSIPAERDTYETGEQINRMLVEFIRMGIAVGEFLPDTTVLETVFLFWGSLAGVIQMAVNKQEYIRKAMNLSRQEFMEFGFERLYRMIAVQRDKESAGVADKKGVW